MRLAGRRLCVEEGFAQAKAVVSLLSRRPQPAASGGQPRVIRPGRALTPGPCTVPPGSDSHS